MIVILLKYIKLLDLSQYEAKLSFSATRSYLLSNALPQCVSITGVSFSQDQSISFPSFLGRSVGVF
jgi:hypothetical protein